MNLLRGGVIEDSTWGRTNSTLKRWLDGTLLNARKVVTSELILKPSLICLDGHTDSVPYRNQQKLSENRAKAVAQYLQSVGFPGNILHPVGHADSQPSGFYTDQDKRTISDHNATPEMMQRNRRVQIALADSCSQPISPEPSKSLP